MHGRVIREIPHLGVEGLSHLGHETLVGDSLAQHRARRVAKRGEQQIVRVEQGPVQVEQNGLSSASSHRPFHQQSIRAKARKQTRRLAQ